MKVKRLLISVLLSSIALVASVSCNKNETTKEKPVITLETSELSFTNEGGTLSAGFSIQNPVEEVFLKYEFSEIPEWILSVNCDEAKEGKFTVTVDKNTTTLAREYSIVLTYPDAADAVIKIAQEAGEEEAADTFSKFSETILGEASPKNNIRCSLHSQTNAMEASLASVNGKTLLSA